MTFAYHRSVAPTMWVFLSLVVIETAVIHLLLAFWSPVAAAILSFVSLTILIWLVFLIRSFRAHPVRIGEGQLHWPAGSLRTVSVDIAELSGTRESWTGELVKARSTFNAALLAYPNVVVELRAPILLGRRKIERLAHKLDDPDAFVGALNRLLEPHDRR